MMRELIVRYRRYEVETTGDFFVIATADLFAAVQLARDAQLNFLNAYWGTTTDETYAALGKAGDGVGSTAPKAWNKLRVRIGVHCGWTKLPKATTTATPRARQYARIARGAAAKCCACQTWWVR
jgi:class 3 adenylate cyclase